MNEPLKFNSLRETVEHYGKDRINSLTKYPSILTYHKTDGRGGLLPEFTTDMNGERLYATEKIDGCNVRLVFYKGEYLIGSRDTILHFEKDLYYETDLDIVDTMKKMDIKLMGHRVNGDMRDVMFVVYGEFYGGKTTSVSKNYGRESLGFRVFDAMYVQHPWSILAKPIEQISMWRERETESGIIYGQRFLNVTELADMCMGAGLKMVPVVPFEFRGTTHQEVVNAMREALPETLAALTPSALKRPEGIVLRTFDRSKIVKLRFEDYERTLDPRRRPQHA